MQGTLGETSYPSMRSHRTGSFTDMIPSKPHASKTPQNLKPIHEASFKNHFSETLPSPVTAHTFRIAPQRDMLASPQTMSFASTEFGLFESPKLQAERGVSLHPSHSRTNSTISVPVSRHQRVISLDFATNSFRPDMDRLRSEPSSFSQFGSRLKSDHLSSRSEMSPYSFLSYPHLNPLLSVQTAEDEDWGTDQSTHPSITDQIGSMSPTASFATLSTAPSVHSNHSQKHHSPPTFLTRFLLPDVDKLSSGPQMEIETLSDLNSSFNSPFVPTTESSIRFPDRTGNSPTNPFSVAFDPLTPKTVDNLTTTTITQPSFPSDSFMDFTPFSDHLQPHTHSSQPPQPSKPTLTHSSSSLPSLLSADPPEVSFTNPFSFDFHPAPTSSPDFSDRPQYSIQSPVSKPLVITLPHTIPPAASHHISLSDPLPVRSPPAITFKPQQSNSVQSWAPISLNTSQTLPGGPVLSPGIQPQPQPRQKKKIVNQTLTWLFSSLSHATLSTMDKNSPALTEMSTQLLTELTQMAQNEPLAQIKSILNSASEAIAVQNAITYGRPESLVAFTKSLQPSLSELLGEIGSSNIIHCLLLREGKERETNPLTQSVLTSCSSIISDGVKTFLPELLCGRVSSRVMQTLINQSPSDISYSIILSIQHNFFSVICDTNGSHCIQLAVKRLNEQQLDGLLDILLSTKNRQVTPIQQAQSLGSLCCHMYACRVVQALLECCSDPQRSRFFTPIAPVAVNLASDAYGNYVMQKILESEDPTIVETISLNLIPHLYSLSLDKIGSNVAEKVMLHCSQNLFFSAILHLFGLSLFLGKIDEDDADALMTLLPHMDKRRLRSILGDQYGNYVVQRVLERATGPVLDFVMASVRLVWTELSSMQHGKHILTTVERIQRRSKKVPAKTNNQPSKTRPNHISIQNTPAKPQAQYSLPQISEPATQTFVPFVQPSSTQQRTIPARSQPSPTLLPLHITLKPQTMNPNSFILGSNGQVTQQVYYP